LRSFFRQYLLVVFCGANDLQKWLSGFPPFAKRISSIYTLREAFHTDALQRMFGTSAAVAAVCPSPFRTESSGDALRRGSLVRLGAIVLDAMSSTGFLFGDRSAVSLPRAREPVATAGP
jgi:hypothetical protein